MDCITKASKCPKAKIDENVIRTLQLKNNNNKYSLK